MSEQSTVGSYLAARLEEIGLRHYFTVPGDYNLVLLDELLKNANLNMISCCNELNAGYAADGYARATGIAGAAVVTYSVGGLSLLNAVAGAYAEDLPIIAISGGPNTNSTAEYELLHHTLGKVDYSYQREIYERVTVEASVVQHPTEAPGQIDSAIERALLYRKPVYLEIASNIAGAPVSQPNSRSFATQRPSDAVSLEGVVAEAAERLNAADKPVLVAGVQLRAFGAEAAFRALAEASGYAVASMPNAKGFFDESQDAYIGIYWGPVSSPGCGEIVESADLALFAGATFSDYTTTGHAALLNPAKMIEARPDQVVVPGEVYNKVQLADFLTALAAKLQRNETSRRAFELLREESVAAPPADAHAPLTTRGLFGRIQELTGGSCTVIAETGDSWFNGMRLDLSSGDRFEIQMQYGSIGWSVGATLGYCLGSPERRVVALIGDGSFQMTAQEVSTMVRYGTKPLIFLINNGGYTIEVEIHDGPYNTIQNWDYVSLLSAFKGAAGKDWAQRVATPAELDAAIAEALECEGPAIIEVAIDRDDCSKNLLKWGGHVAKNNSRPRRTF